jgi:hypothetical protein
MIDEHNRASIARTVRVSIPHKVSFDLPRMQKITAEILGRLGCGLCHSGFDIRWNFEDRFVLDQKLEVHEIQDVRIGP